MLSGVLQMALLDQAMLVAQEASAGAVAVQFLILIALVVGIGYFIRSRVQKAASKQNARQRAERPRKGTRLTSGGKKLRVHELATELGITRAETVALCQKLGVPVKSDTSSLNETYADMVRRRAAHDALIRKEYAREEARLAEIWERRQEVSKREKEARAKSESKKADVQNRTRPKVAPWNDEEVNLAAEQPWTTFLQAIEIRYMSHRNALMSPGARNQVAPTDRPVAHARQSVIEAYRQNESGSRNDARKTLDRAIVQADSGSIFPDAGEWPIDGVDVGRAHACMWGAIARVFAHKQSSDWASTDATKSDAWFGVATLLFLENRESVMAGRTLEEWGESRRIFGDSESAALLLTCAVPLFLLGGESERAELAGNRIHAVGPVPQASSFLRGEMPSPTERSRLSSVLGASNARSFYESLE